jgi:hypothetical protein
MRLTVPAAMLLIVLPAASHAECGKERSLVKVTNYGHTITLDDDTVWRVDDGDEVKSQAWQEHAPIVVCGDRLTNNEYHETVGAVRDFEAPSGPASDTLFKPKRAGVAEEEAPYGGLPPAPGSSPKDAPYGTLPPFNRQP